MNLKGLRLFVNVYSIAISISQFITLENRDSFWLIFEEIAQHPLTADWLLEFIISMWCINKDYYYIYKNKTFNLNFVDIDSRVISN